MAQPCGGGGILEEPRARQVASADSSCEGCKRDQVEAQSRPRKADHGRDPGRLTSASRFRASSAGRRPRQEHDTKFLGRGGFRRIQSSGGVNWWPTNNMHL